MDVITLLWALSCATPEPDPAPPAAVACANRDPNRMLLWGDLHVHTALSFDAWIYDVRLEPDDAYRFAQGETVMLPPLDGDGAGTVPYALERPLDFAAVTDHAEYLAEVAACTDPDSPVYDISLCVDYRAATPSSIQVWGTRFVPVQATRFDEICNAGVDCTAGALDVWSQIQAAAEAANDATEQCRFTSFVAYEWSSTTNISNYHRNVIFRNASVPELPTSTFEASSPDGLWAALRADCLDAGTGCDVLAIPHNANQSNGNLFEVEYESAEAAAARMELEPLLEVYQHKGDSECREGLSGYVMAPDELCGFEKLRAGETDDCGEEPGSGGMANFGCQHRLDFLRGILLAGVQEEERIGVNPHKLGVIASTDTHSATPGMVEEFAYQGHLGLLEGTPEARLDDPELNPGGVRNGPGGLAAVWAEENSREAIFQALRRREVYGTSGPRIAVRMFVGYDLPTDLCDSADLVERADAAGVPMGSDLPEGEGPPSLVIQALQDAGTQANPGNPLQRIQVVKGFVHADGTPTIEVFDVVGGDDGQQVDLATCAVDEGHSSLCTVWTDPSWEAGQHGFYYARVLEVPSCRWSWYDCLTYPDADRPEQCDDPEVPRTIQERAWTSPVWY
jgi:hypothetical protein